MKKFIYLIVLTLILGLVLTGCTLLSNIGQAPATDQSGITYLTKGPSPDLVGLWHFDGDALDSSGNGNHGILKGDADFDIGMFGQALSVDGAGDYVEIGDIGVTGDWTVEFWANLGSASSTIYYPIGLSLGSPNGKGIFVGGTYAPTAGKWGVYDGTNWILGSNVYTDTWYHFAVTKSGTTYTLYRGAAYENSGVLTDIDISDLDIGRRSEGVWYFDGLIDEVRIWNFALSKDQLGKVYDFAGFFSPVENPPAGNMVKAGRAIPVKFSLNGDQGLDNIFVPGYPKSIPIKCDDTDPEGEIEVTATAGGSSLSYDAIDDQYTYVWKTDKVWAGTCRQLVVKLIDGTSHVANFTFK